MNYKNEVSKILVIAPSWVGDMMMAQSLFKLLKQQNPEVVIDILAHSYLSPLIKYMPEINRVIETDFKHGSLNFRQRFQLAKKLLKEKYDQAIILPNSFKAALIPFFAKIPIRTGWRGEFRYGLLNDLRILDKNLYPLMAERFLALGIKPEKSIKLTENLFPKLIPNPIQISATLQKLNLLKAAKPILALCIGAEYGSAKRWPAKYFAKVAAKKIADGWEVWLVGSPKDQAIGEKIISEIKIFSSFQSIHNLTGKTNLAEAVDLLSQADVIISNDSGLMHIAAALDLPLIAIFGSSTPKFTPPLTDKAKIISLNLKCSPCFKKECPLSHLKCLAELKPEMVLDVLNSII